MLLPGESAVDDLHYYEQLGPCQVLRIGTAAPTLAPEAAVDSTAGRVCKKSVTKLLTEL